MPYVVVILATNSAAVPPTALATTRIATVCIRTVNSYLSKHFQGHIKDGRLFTPEYSGKKLLEVFKKSYSSSNRKMIRMGW